MSEPPDDRPLNGIYQMSGSTFRWALFAAAAAGLGGCGPTEPVAVPERLDVVSGDAQVGTVGRRLAEPLRVRVGDDAGRGIEGIFVRYEVVAGDGGLTVVGGGGTSNGSPAASMITGSDGVAEVAWILGLRATQQLVAARVNRLPSVTFSADAEPGPPAAAVLISGSGQRGPIGEELSEPLYAAVLDEYGNEIPAQPFDWRVTSGRATLLPRVEESLRFASIRVIPESAGTIAIGAEHEGLAPVEFKTIGQAHTDDPQLDDFATAASANLPPVDLSEVRAWPEGAELQVMMWFTDFQQPGFLTQDEALTGYVDLDVDQDPATGAMPLSDRLRRDGGSSGLGADYSVSLFTMTGEFDLLDADSVRIGRVRGRFAGNTVRLWIPLRLLGDDDGYVDLVVVVGNIPEPTDVAPNAGALRILRPDPVNER